MKESLHFRPVFKTPLHYLEALGRNHQPQDFLDAEDLLDFLVEEPHNIYVLSSETHPCKAYACVSFSGNTMSLERIAVPQEGGEDLAAAVIGYCVLKFGQHGHIRSIKANCLADDIHVAAALGHPFPEEVVPWFWEHKGVGEDRWRSRVYQYHQTLPLDDRPLREVKRIGRLSRM